MSNHPTDFMPDNPSGCMSVVGQPRRVHSRHHQATRPRPIRLAPHALRAFRTDQVLDAGGAWLPLALAVLGMAVGYLLLPVLAAWLGV